MNSLKKNARYLHLFSALTLLLLLGSVFFAACGPPPGTADDPENPGKTPAEIAREVFPAEAHFGAFFAPFFMSSEDWGKWESATDVLMDFFYSDSTKEAGFRSPSIDMTFAGSAILDLTPEIASQMNSYLFTPPGVLTDGRLSIVADTDTQMPTGEVAVFATEFADTIPLQDPDHNYTFSVVIDSDGDPANNFVFVPPFDLDLYQGTDRWYELNWWPDVGEWQLLVTSWGQMQLAWEADTPAETTSDAVAVIDDNLLVFFIPVGEFEVSRPDYRVTGFGSDGTYAPGASGADVIGQDTITPSLFQQSLPEWSIPLQVDFSFE